MYQFILLIHVLVAVCIIALVLVQQGKGATVGAAFGSGASQTVFGSRGSGSFLFRLTAGLMAIFFFTSIGLNYLVMHAYKQEKTMTLPIMPRQSSSPPLLPMQQSQVPLSPTHTDHNAGNAETTVMPGEIPIR